MRKYLKFIRDCFLGNPIKTLFLAIRKKTICVLVFPNVHLNIDPLASITGDGKLELGKKWKGLRYLPSEFNVTNGSRVVVTGKFSVYTGFHISVSNGSILTLGDGYINNNATIDCFKSVTIGDGVVISKGVTIRDSDNHVLNNEKDIHAPIVIEDDVWIGLNATILKGVHVASGSVVAAGAVVIRNVPKNTLVAGVPAQVVKENIIWE